MSSGINKEQWVGLFREIGLDESKMQQWHSVFEKRHPDGHQHFLEWLGLPDEKVDAIRAQSR